MSPISFFNRHPRADFSAYLDGELTSAEDKRIEAHIAACSTCSAELESLREMRTALRALPETPAPRSFALTPGMAREARPARLAPATRPMQPLVNGLRMASGGLAAALAVVIVIAVAGSGSNDTNDDGGLSAARLETAGEIYSAAPTESLAQDAGSDSAATSAPQSTASPLSTPFPNSGGIPLPGDGSGSGGSAGGGTGGGTSGGSGGVGGVGGSGTGGDDGSGTEVPPPGTVPPDAVTTPEPSPEDIVSDEDGFESSTVPAKAANADDISTTGTGDEAPAGDDASNGGGGTSALTIAAIVLGVLLGASVIGSIAASRLSRRTP